jgi:hypothetical protein
VCRAPPDEASVGGDRHTLPAIALIFESDAQGAASDWQEPFKHFQSLACGGSGLSANPESVTGNQPPSSSQDTVITGPKTPDESNLSTVLKTGRGKLSANENEYP